MHGTPITFCATGREAVKRPGEMGERWQTADAGGQFSIDSPPRDAITMGLNPHCFLIVCVCGTPRRSCVLSKTFFRSTSPGQKGDSSSQARLRYCQIRKYPTRHIPSRLARAPAGKRVILIARLTPQNRAALVPCSSQVCADKWALLDSTAQINRPFCGVGKLCCSHDTFWADVLDPDVLKPV